MYTPSEFRVNDPAVLTDFLVQHPFGMLMLNGLDGIPVVTHLPFVVSGSDDDLVLEGHIARANAQAELLKTGKLAKIVVEGARGYVSSSVYTHVNVPTYNYQAVHVVGSLELMSSEELMNHLRIVVDRFERDRIAPIDFNAWPQQLLETYCAQIVGFRLVPFRIEGAFKLSQNRNQTDFERIVADLEKGSVEQQQLALAMLKTRT